MKKLVFDVTVYDKTTATSKSGMALVNAESVERARELLNSMNGKQKIFTKVEFLRELPDSDEEYCFIGTF